MLSGNGRHRRPRQAPALLVAAGVTGSAIAIPLLGATGASAASGATWDQVAECESGGAWSANTGNGYYGGLQLSQENWEKYGGREYAERADQASRSQQIAVAERILADQGVGVWASCGLLTGLGRDSGSADVDTGVVGDGQSGSSDSSDSSGTPDSSGISGSSDASDPSGTSDSSGTSDPSPDVAEGSTKADTGLVDTGESTSQDSDSSATGDTGSGASGNSQQGADSSTGGDGEESAETGTETEVEADTETTGTGRHRGDSADESADEGATGGRIDDGRTGTPSGRHASREAPDDGSYVVRTGDTLWAIADSLGVEGGWSVLYADNRGTVGADPNHIMPGQTLELGVESGEKQR
ncbi:transglycosylase family protein [Streptomyces sp. NPDC002845]